VVRAQLWKVAALVIVLAAAAGCAAGRAFSRGEQASRVNDWDTAVAFYRKAVQAAPDHADYKIALERAMLNASHVHFATARQLEEAGDLDGALREYKQASEYDPTNRRLAAKAIEVERTIRDRLEAARPKPPIEQMKEKARQMTPEPILNPASREPLRIRFTNASLKDILNFIANASGINITYDRDFQDRPYTVELDGVTLEQALSQILTANQLFYKVLNERTIIVIPDNTTKRAQYEEQVIRTFYVSNADVTELGAMLNQIMRLPQMGVQPMIAVNKSSNTITVRAGAAVAAIIERVIEANDKPRAEVVLDVEILEVNRSRAKQYGLNLTDYALGGIFSPEVSPSTSSTGTGGTTIGTGTAPSSVGSPPPFNLNTISRGINTADFYLAVPAAVVRFLESDSETKLIAKPQLRGSEGQKLSLNLGDEIPVPSTTFTPIVGGGTAFNPLTSFQYRTVGLNVEATPRVSFEGEIILDLYVESSSVGQQVNIAGQNLPSFGSRKVTTRLRLRDGEPNLLAGLLREDERKTLQGFLGLIHVPVLKDLFGANNNQITQTDIVMLLTPRILRTHELSQKDLNPIYIGTQQNLGLGGPPPLINVPGATPEGAAGAPPAAAPAAAPPGAAVPLGTPPAPGQPVPGAQPGPLGTPVVPPGSSPIPGTTTMPATPAGQPPATPPQAPVPSPAAPQPPAGAPASPPQAGPTPPPATVQVTPPGTEFRVGGGPYTVPISISGVSRVSTVSLTITYNPAVLRVRAVQEGSFMRQGGVNATFAQQVDAPAGRIDITVTRPGDTTGASGVGLLAAIVFDAAAPGGTTLTPSGVASGPGGAVVPLQFAPVTVTVK